MELPSKYRDRDTENFANGEYVRRFEGFSRKVGLARLERLYVVTILNDLRIPPGNRFEALKGNRAGQYSIRIND